MQFNRLKNNVNNFYKDTLEKELSSREEEIKALIMTGYEKLYELSDNNSKLHPSSFREDFESSLNKFSIIKKGDLKLTVSIPDMDNFDFTDLYLIQQILEGTVGVYVEITQDDLELLKIPTTYTVMSSVNSPDKVYLLPYTNEIKLKELELNKKFLIFPFSDSPPLYNLVFGGVKEFITSNMDLWISTALKNSSTIISQKYKRI